MKWFDRLLWRLAPVWQIRRRLNEGAKPTTHGDHVLPPSDLDSDPVREAISDLTGKPPRP